MNQNKTRVLFLLAQACIVVVSGLVRVLPLHDSVLTEEGIRFQGIDAHYHARLSTYVSLHYPQRLQHDDLRLHPSGQHVDVYPAFDFLNATVAQLVCLGDPDAQSVEIVAAWTPPILGSLTSGILGAAGWVVAGPWGGLAAGAVAGFLPGGTVGQTVIGFTDHHALESFLLSVAWLLLALLSRGGLGTRGVVILSFLLGTTAAVYTLTWEGGPVLPAAIVLVLSARMVFHAEPGRLKHQLLESSVVTITAALVLALWSFHSKMVWVSAIFLAIGPVISLCYMLVGQILPTSPHRRRLVVWSISMGVVAASTYALAPGELRQALETNISRLVPSATAQTVSEMRPIISDSSLVWAFYGPPLLWSIIGLVLGFKSLFTNRQRGSAVPVAIALLFVPAGLMQTRFSASASLVIALLNAVVLVDTVEIIKERFRKKKTTGGILKWGFVSLWVLTAAVWSFSASLEVAGVDRGPEAGWLESMAWLRANAPDPLAPAESEDSSASHSPPRSHGVLNWWDSGYYLVRMAGQRPVSNPTQSGASWAARLFLDTSSADWSGVLRNNNIRYIVTDAHLAYYPTGVNRIDSRFPALPVWAGRSVSEFMQTVYFRNQDGSLEPRFAYLPAYFQSSLIRLLMYGGNRYDPPSGVPWVIKTSPMRTPEGSIIDVIESGQAFQSYEDARRFLENPRFSSWRLVSFSPFTSCTALDPLPGVREVFASRAIAAQPPDFGKPIPFVRIFEVDGFR